MSAFKSIGECKQGDSQRQSPFDACLANVLRYSDSAKRRFVRTFVTDGIDKSKHLEGLIFLNPLLSR